ncbi:hypothetical protein A4A49_26237 [Nicotiana attenuata]|uniref:Uncharacterized protein n=1 Tax=Nicotiana attenuata TaxID=49451 RepID=A0A1J6IYY1_NICAT|nr:hypothetical protein A4A49_26237 [Nicotiana attenuata]
MSYREMSMDTIIEDYRDSFDSNTDAIIYAASDISGWTQSLISDPNIPNSSNSTSVDDDHHQQISTAAGGGTDDLIIISSCASSSMPKNNDKQSDQEMRIFNVDFRAFSGAAVVYSPSSSSPTQPENNFQPDYQLETQEDTAFRGFRSAFNLNNIPIAARDRSQSMLNRSITFSRNLYLMKMSEQIQVNHQTTTNGSYEMPMRRDAAALMICFNNEIFAPREQRYGKDHDFIQTLYLTPTKKLKEIS